MSEPGKPTQADIDDLLAMIYSQARGDPDVMRMALYLAPCPACQHDAALLLPKGFCCERCATIHNGERVILQPTHHRKGPSWSFTLDVRDSVRSGKGQRIPMPEPAGAVSWSGLLTQTLEETQ